MTYDKIIMVVRSFIVLEEWEVEKGKMLRVRIAMKRKQLQKGEAESREASSPIITFSGLSYL